MLNAHFSALLAVLFVSIASTFSSPTHQHSKRGLDTGSIAQQRFGNDKAWYQDRIPYFDSSDTLINDVYYYRWKVLRAHQRDLGVRGYISTEFAQDVSWQISPWASLNDATAFHIKENRFNRDRRFTDDLLTNMYNIQPIFNDRHFSESIADAAYARYMIDGDAAGVTKLLGGMQTVYNQWQNDHFDTSKGLYWIEPLYDATEYTLSSIAASGGQDGFGGGQAFRPSINSYQIANAKAISAIATLAGQTSVAKDYAQRAATLKTTMQNALWNSTFSHFIDRYQVNNQYVKYYDFIIGRELVGYLPWTFNITDDRTDYNSAWSHLLNTAQLAGKAGPRTNEPSSPYYMHQYRYDGSSPECQWNGPLWPFQLTQVAVGMANFIDRYKQSTVAKKDYLSLIRQYAQIHYSNGILDLQEDYNPDTGNVIVGLDRSHHYFHSGFIDLIVTGIVGIRDRPDDVLEVNPMIDGSSLKWFRMEEIPYKGHNVAVQWDVDGSHYGTKGLVLEIEGTVIATRADLGRLTGNVPRKAVIPIYAPIAKSIALNGVNNITGTASSATDTANIYQAIDGRVIFLDPIKDGWQSASTGSASQQWFQIDFGLPTSISRTEIAFYSNSNDVVVPTDYQIQYNSNGNWINLNLNYKDQPLANGITNAGWNSVNTQQVRILMNVPANKSVRLTEFKIF